MLVGLKRISTALGILAASAAVAQAQGVAPSANQSTANAVASVLRSSPMLSGYRIDIETQQGTVTLTGTVANAAQKADALARVRSVAGVTGVVDHLNVTGDRRLRRVQYVSGPVEGMPMEGAPMASGPITSGPVGPADSGPLPEGTAGAPGGSMTGSPNMPNYAWPSYAPYPNFSAVGYPTAYPWQAWPNIGPPYPYPEVPLDWRAVTLRWCDGIWWLDFKKHYTRPFFTPYPFGLFAY